MTVKELIQNLEKYPTDKLVKIEIYGEDGCLTDVNIATVQESGRYIGVTIRDSIYNELSYEAINNTISKFVNYGKAEAIHYIIKQTNCSPQTALHTLFEVMEKYAHDEITTLSSEVQQLKLEISRSEK